MVAQNREYKDRLFSFLFGSGEHDDWTLSLYNAVNGSDYQDPSAIEFTTIKEVLYLGMHNDVSFLIADTMNLYEQQSSYNPNMPLRMLQYAGNLYERHIRVRRLNKFGGSLIKLPAPRFVTFYNGMDDQPDEVTLRLSDSFPEGATTDVEVCVRMLNINHGKNRELMDACRPLAEYSWLVAKVRENTMGMNRGAATGVTIDRAIAAMPDDFVIKPYLVAHQAEVRGMLLTEYNEAEAMELFREEGRAEGRAEGMLDVVCSIVSDGILPPDEGARRVGLTEEEFAKAMEERGLRV